MPNRYKLVVNVPFTHAHIVRQALGQAGAGKVGNYTFCSFSVKGVGRFLPGNNARPYIGACGIHEETEEEQIQVEVSGDDMKSVLAALKKAHPYEEPGYEIYQMIDESIF
ncbi:MAG: hypothetical protein HYS17_07695 [Micavibrio aeruginosavorus]|uniref:NGG1p interacting factor NIF3 n=1 Tax=Micavibrio aeruginosavorus TaxID=349221 RepID=A0A7T5R0R3_9BACT|nr:MAG: hypothetical protein HYS17_07695 [Micavibrio aeruginosavorus]